MVDGLRAPGVARHVRRGTGVVARLACNYKGERASLLRMAAFSMLRRLTPVVAIDHNGSRYFVGTHDALGANLFSLRQFDEAYFAATLRLCERHYPDQPREGRILLDVGANIGTTTVPALARYGFSRAIAIEPAPNNLFLLRQNVFANGLSERVTVVPAAVSDEDGTLEFALSPHNSADHRARRGEAAPGPLGEEAWSSITVPAQTLDTILDQEAVAPEDIGLVWMDVQGFEGHALAGAGQLVEAPVPVLLEYWPYGLRRAGGEARLWELVAKHYRAFVDVRAAQDTGDDAAQPSDALPGLDVGGTLAFTDILLVK